MGAKAYPIIEEIRPKMTGAILEIGSERNEGSTTFLANFSLRNNLRFYSVDMDQENLQVAQSLPHVRSFQMRGEDFLKRMLESKEEKFSFVYLDNYDWLWNVAELKDPNSYYNQLVRKYQQSGLVLNNFHSQVSHLEQAILVEQMLTDVSYVLFDDTWTVADSTWHGKGAAAIAYLKLKGFQVRNTHINGYATLMSREL